MSKVSGMMTEQDKIIETTHLHFRQNTRQDIERLFSLMSDPDVMRFVSAPFSMEQTHDWLDFVIKQYEIKEYLSWAVELKQNEKYIGQACIAEQLVEGQKEVEIGCFINKNFWGQGYGKEIIRVCRDYAINELGHKRLISIINPKNTASIKMAMSNGFCYERDIVWQGNSVSIYAR